MSEENVEIIQRLVEAYNEHGIGEATAEFFDAAAVYDEPPEQPEAGVAHGRDEVGRLFARFDQAWEEHRLDPEQIRAIDDEGVLLLSLDRFRGRDGIELVQPSTTIFTLRGRKIVRMQPFWDRQRAMRAAGLRE